MESVFKSVVLIGRAHTEGVAETLRTLIKLLQTYKLKVALEHNTAEIIPNSKIPTISHEQLGKECDLIIVVGGDGSLLNAAHIAAKENIPVVGINRGTLGFLTDIRPDEITNIEKILRGEFIEEQRFLLSCEIKAKNKVVSSQLALNDVVLLPSEMNRMIEFSVYINDKFVCDHRADGMIVATPTGSTAHSLSGGGAILNPELNAILLLPMFPHNLSSRPIVVSADSKIEIVMAKSCNACPNISCDGQKLIPLPESGKITIHKYTKPLRLIHLHDYNYYETLRGKLHWEIK